MYLLGYFISFTPPTAVIMEWMRPRSGAAQAAVKEAPHALAWEGLAGRAQGTGVTGYSLGF